MTTTPQTSAGPTYYRAIRVTRCNGVREDMQVGTTYTSLSDAKKHGMVDGANYIQASTSPYFPSTGRDHWVVAANL